MTQTIKTLDLKQLLCPMPVIRTQKAVEQLQTDEMLKVICTDPGTQHDIPALCRVNGYHLVATQQQDQNYIFYVKKDTIS